MYKKFFLAILLFFFNCIVFASTPIINWVWLPGNDDTDIMDPSNPSLTQNIGIQFIASVIWEIIQFIAVIAVIALIISGIMYLISAWEEEKTKKAKTWIIWSLVWVFLSISAWWIINIINGLTID